MIAGRCFFESINIMIGAQIFSAVTIVAAVLVLFQSIPSLGSKDSKIVLVLLLLAGKVAVAQIVSAILVFVAVAKRSPQLLKPMLGVQILVLFLNVVLLQVAVIGIVWTGSPIASLVRDHPDTRYHARSFGWDEDTFIRLACFIIVLILSLTMALNAWFFSILIECFKYLKSGYTQPPPTKV